MSEVEAHNDESDREIAETPVSKDEPLYRAMKKGFVKGYTVGEKPARGVFMRRSPFGGKVRDPKGLSVELMDGRDEPTTCKAAIDRLEGQKGACIIYADAVRSEGYDVLSDDPTHANIKRLPDVPIPEDTSTPEGRAALEYAEFAGANLARHSTIVYIAP